MPLCQLMLTTILALCNVRGMNTDEKITLSDIDEMELFLKKQFARYSKVAEENGYNRYTYGTIYDASKLCAEHVVALANLIEMRSTLKEEQSREEKSRPTPIKSAKKPS